MIENHTWMKNIISHRMLFKYIIIYFYVAHRVTKMCNANLVFFFYFFKLSCLQLCQSVSLSVCSCPSMCPSFSLFLHSLTGLCVVRLSGHYMRHLFARCYCLHGADFIRCRYNFINLVGERSLYSFYLKEDENGEAKRSFAPETWPH